MLATHRWIFYLLLSKYSLSTDGFQWSDAQQSSHVTSTSLGLQASLPCDYMLTSSERVSMRTFHVMAWSKEDPKGSGNWTGVAIKSSLQPEPQIIYQRGQIQMENNTLIISQVSLDDDSNYKCEISSSFYTTPFVAQLNVLFAPMDAQISTEAVAIPHGESLKMECKARANPAPSYAFFLNDNLLQNTSSGQLVIKTASSRFHGGTYSCVPTNILGRGSAATVTISVLAPRPSEPSSPLSIEYIAAAAAIGGALLIIIIILITIICHNKKPTEESAETKCRMRTNKPVVMQVDAAESYVGPGMYSSQSLEVVNDSQYITGRCRLSSTLSLQNCDLGTPRVTQL
ncbi:cell surface A33 antigen [Nematostella vectensis]|uniref:cell surface A33 antigen n=1 Tax=Nematostella vectensis TaxID=45351 RepID=UPI0020772452|nr:cell surface A33 antigen [Nematostella vectensis]